MTRISGMSQEHLGRGEQTLIGRNLTDPIGCDRLYRVQFRDPSRGIVGDPLVAAEAASIQPSEMPKLGTNTSTRLTVPLGNQVISHLQAESRLARAWARLYQDRVIKDLRQGDGQRFLLPAT